jgi:hypothetical protein
MLYQSDKKNFGFYVTSIKSATKLSSHIKFYQPNFLCHRYDNTPTALEYVLGLITCEKNTANMERMEEAVDSSEYRRYQHFISHSKWDHQGIFKKVQYQASEALAIQKEKNGQPTGLIIDESSHIKKGKNCICRKAGLRMLCVVIRQISLMINANTVRSPNWPWIS